MPGEQYYEELGIVNGGRVFVKLNEYRQGVFQEGVGEVVKVVCVEEDNYVCCLDVRMY